MVKQAGRKVGGRRKNSAAVENPGLKADSEFSAAGKRALAFRRFLLFVLTAVLLAVGLASVCGIGF